MDQEKTMKDIIEEKEQCVYEPDVENEGAAAGSRSSEISPDPETDMDLPNPEQLHEPQITPMEDEELKLDLSYLAKFTIEIEKGFLNIYSDGELKFSSDINLLQLAVGDITNVIADLVTSATRVKLLKSKKKLEQIVSSIKKKE